MTRTIALLILIAALLAGCEAKSTASATPSTDYDIQGNITQIMRDGLPKGVFGYLRIEGEKAAGNRYDKAVVAVTKSTRIWEKKGNAYVPATWDDLLWSATVTAKFTGPVRESYPVQADAAEIVILVRIPRQ